MTSKAISALASHGFAIVSTLVVIGGASCADSERNAFTGTDASTTSEADGGLFDPTGPGFGDGSAACEPSCSTDLSQVLDCSGAVVATCTGTDGCDAITHACSNACANAVKAIQSVGCEYYAAFTEMSDSSLWVTDETCFAVYVANTWSTAAHVEVSRGGNVLPVESFGYLPKGTGPGLTLDPYDASAGIPPGGVAVLLLVGAQGTGKTRCPAPSAMPGGAMVSGTGVGTAFRVSTDVPVVAYQVNPYGGGNAAVTGASLLIPTSAWDTNYIGVDA